MKTEEPKGAEMCSKLPHFQPPLLLNARCFLDENVCGDADKHTHTRSSSVGHPYLTAALVPLVYFSLAAAS